MLHDPRWKTRLRGAVVDRTGLDRLIPAWEALCRRSLDDNVYYSPKYARALLQTVDKRPDLRFVTVWEGERLVAFLPVAKIAARRFGLPFVHQAWRTPYTFGCMPLIDRERAEDATATLLETMKTIGADWVLPRVDLRSATAQAIVSALRKEGRAWAGAGHFMRAAFEEKPSFETHMEACVSAKRRRDLARNRRRLEELGTVAYQSHCAGKGLRRAVEAFLDIEAGGWKGARGTALACREETRAFALSAFTGETEDSICRADMLLLDGRPIAVSLMVFAGDTGFTVKCAYDEAYRNYGAGLLLEIEVIRSFLSENWIGRLDAATAGTHVIDKLWPSRIEVADLVFSFARMAPRLRVAALCRSIEAKRDLKARLKRMLAWLAERRRT